MKCFPKAEGFGTDTTHARDPAAVSLFVTNLNDDGPGSRRQALLYPGHAYIQYRVAGVINQTSRAVKYKFSNKYEAGQTSPGGVCVVGEENQVQTHDLVIRHMRFRAGDEDIPTNAQGVETGWDNRDAMNSGEHSGSPPVGTGVTHDFVIDHCSHSSGVDECLTFWDDTHDFTVCNEIVSNGLFHSFHPKGPHSMGMLCGIQAKNASWHHFILANCNQRMPQVAGDTNLASIIDVRAGLIFNWGEEGFAIEHLGNKINAVSLWFQLGPDFNAPTKKPFRVANSASDFQMYVAGCVLQDGNLKSDPDADNWPLLTLDNGSTPPTFGHQMATPFAAPAVTTETAFVARQLVLQNAGATKPFRDSWDLKVLGQIRKVRCGKKPGERFFIDTIKQNGGFPTFAAGEVPFDSNDDGIPDYFCEMHGLGVFDTIHNVISDDGYPWIERYLSYLAGDPAP